MSHLEGKKETCRHHHPPPFFCLFFLFVSYIIARKNDRHLTFTNMEPQSSLGSLKEVSHNILHPPKKNKNKKEVNTHTHTHTHTRTHTHTHTYTSEFVFNALNPLFQKKTRMSPLHKLPSRQSSLKFAVCSWQHCNL